MRFDHVGVNVASLPEMTEWYVGALGLEIEFEFALEASGFSGAMLRSPLGYRVELLHRVDLEATHRRLLAAGATERMPPSQSPEPGVRISFVSDPEGNLIELLDRRSLVEEGRSPVTKPGDVQGSLSSHPGFVTGASAPSSTSGESS